MRGGWIGIPYEGCDCWELVRRFYRAEYGVRLPALGADRAMLDGWAVIPAGSEAAGDVLVFRLGRHKRHVGVVMDAARGLMLHTERGINSCIARYRTTLWRDRLHRIYRRV